MKKFSVIVTSVVLLAAFLWGSTGITVYSHYCSLSDSVNTSLFVDDADCDHHIEKAVTQSCCDEKKSCSSEMEDTDCCATQKQVFKLVSVFDVPGEKQQIKIVDFKLFECKKTIFEEKDIYVGEFKIPEELPPGSFGKKLLLAIHQQKIAPAPLV